MKKLLFVFLTIIGLQGFVIAQQRYAVIDTKSCSALFAIAISRREHAQSFRVELV